MPQIHHAFDIARPHGSRHRFLLGLRVHVASSALQTRQAVPVVGTEERIKPRPGMANGCRRWPALRKGGWGALPRFLGRSHPVVILIMNVYESSCCHIENVMINQWSWTHSQTKRLEV